MAIRSYYRTDLASIQLETALRLFAEGDDFASVITLAGAADEIFGKTLAASGRENSLEVIMKSVAAIHNYLYGESTPPQQIASRANHAKNSLKHWDRGDPNLISLDLPEEARDMLNRAIDNYWALEERLSPAMEEFQRKNMGA